MLGNVQLNPDATATRTYVSASPREADELSELEALNAELQAIVVDLEARAKYGRVEGVALPLLDHAQGLVRRLQRITAEVVQPRALAAEISRSTAQLVALQLAFDALREAQSVH